jgi:hypothetical protein
VGPPDAGSPETGGPDAESPDAGTPDAGTPETGGPDAGPDTGSPDAEAPETGAPDTGPDAPTDAGSDVGTIDGAIGPDGAMIDEAGDGGACHSLNELQPPHDEMQVAAPPPVLNGGAVNPGLYVRTGTWLYTGAGGASGPTGNVENETLDIVTLTTAHSIARLNGIVERRSYMTAFGGRFANFNGICGPPPAPMYNYEYEATPTTLRLKLSNKVYDYQRQ